MTAPDGNRGYVQRLLAPFTLKELLLEIEYRGILITEAGYYPTLGTDMAIGARNLLDSLPHSLLKASPEGPKDA